MTTTATTAAPFDATMRSARLALGGLALLFAVGLLIPIGGAVIAPGAVGVESHVKRVAHPLGGTIAAVLVKNGDHVEAGAPLIRFDSTVSGPEAALSTLSVAQMRALKARLEAEQLDSLRVSYPADLAHDADGQKAMRDEDRMFSIRRTELAGTRLQLGARIAQYRQQVAGLRVQIGAIGRQMNLIQPERAGLADLYAKGLITLSRKNQLERQAVDYQASVAALDTRIAETEAKIAEAREQQLQLEQSRRAEAGAQLATLNNALSQQQVRNVTALDAAARSIVRAPYRGTIDKLAFNAAGDVVKPAEPILDIVPDADRKVIEVSIAASDVDQVTVGQAARIRFSGFNGPTSPEVEGHVSQLSANRTVDPDTHRAMYLARVAFDPERLSADTVQHLVPGMPVEVFIATGSRSLISYVLKPLRDQMARAFRDDSR